MGGWSNVITQNSKILPQDLPKIRELLKKFERDFNSFIDKANYEPIRFGDFVGSTHYYERDLIENPSKEYGDVDVIFVIPRIWQMKESINISMYRELIDDFLQYTEPNYLAKAPFTNGTNVIFKLDEKYIQVDFIATCPIFEEWTTHRMTPQYGLKGIFMGFLYASLAEVLYLSIGTSGIQAKIADGKMIPFKKRKFDNLVQVTRSVEFFAIDVVTFFSHLQHNDATVSFIDLKNPDTSEISFAHLVSIIIGIGKSLELNELFGVGNLSHIKNYDDYISQIVSVFNRKADESANASKFNKASTEEAIQKANETKKMITEKSKELVKLIG